MKCKHSWFSIGNGNYKWCRRCGVLRRMSGINPKRTLVDMEHNSTLKTPVKQKPKKSKMVPGGYTVGSGMVPADE